MDQLCLSPGLSTRVRISLCLLCVEQGAASAASSGSCHHLHLALTGRLCRTCQSPIGESGVLDTQTNSFYPLWEKLGTGILFLISWLWARSRHSGKRLSWIFPPALVNLVLHSPSMELSISPCFPQRESMNCCWIRVCGVKEGLGLPALPTCWCHSISFLIYIFLSILKMDFLNWKSDFSDGRSPSFLLSSAIWLAIWYKKRMGNCGL